MFRKTKRVQMLSSHNYGNMFQYSAIIILLFVVAIVSPEYNFSSHDHRNKRQSPTDNCPAPTIKNGKFVVLGFNYTQGSSIPNYASVKFFCNKNHALFPNLKLITCDEGSWSASVPECKPTCPPLTSTSVDVECTFNNRTVNCSNPVLDGTVARCKCKEYYVSVHTHQFPTIKCKGGDWEKPLIECEPDCGEGISKGVTNVVKGKAAKLGEFPWHIALYRVEENKHMYKCGGSIIHPLIIITAAHCFTDLYGEKYPAEEYWVAAGKYYSAYGSPDDKLSQTRQVKEYHIPPYYKGFDTHFQADLAVVVVKTEFHLSSVVRPVCVDWYREFERQQLVSDAYGTVVGWGYVDPHRPSVSEDLKKLTAPFIEISKCLAVVPPDFTRWVTPDKFCAGLTNGSSVCLGDSGGGMVFSWTVNNKLKYYLRGIVSVGPAETETDGCDSHQYGVYTLVTHYSDFVQDVVANNSEVKTQAYIISSYGSCRIPALENGKFLYLDKEYTEGYSIPNYSFLRIYCNENYVLYPEMPYLNCANTTWHIPVPKCKKTCPPLIPPLANVSVSCSVDGKTLDCSDSVVEGTVAQITCKYGSKIFARCAAGFWSERDPFKKCVQESMECTKENPEFCNIATTVRPPLEIGSCPEPKIENGKYEVLGHNSKSFIPNLSVVKISCNKNYALTSPAPLLVCLDGVWSTKIPECKRTCPARIPSSSVDTECIVDDMQVNCSKPLVEGAIVRSICKRHYVPTQLTPHHVSVCIGGTWDKPPLHCQSACGIVRNRGTPLIIGGKLKNVNEFPWHTLIYRYQNGKFNYQCGGSIISRTAVITAAHCVTTFDGALKPINEYYIGAGKSHSTYNSSEDFSAQMRKIKDIHIPSRFKGAVTNYQADIAVIVVANSFLLTEAVLPVCVDWNRMFERELLQSGARGKDIRKWPVKRDNDFMVSRKPRKLPVVVTDSAADDSLQELNLPYIETSACLNMVSQQFLRWVTPDKFCIGYTNGSNVCRGDSGSGIAFSSNDKKNYITGIASVGPTDDGVTCGGPVTLFTRISYYTDWIVNILASNNDQD